MFFALPFSRHYYLDDLLSDLMNAIGNPGELGVFCLNNSIHIKVVVVIKGITDTYDFPSLHLRKDFVVFLSTINAGFQCMASTV